MKRYNAPNLPAGNLPDSRFPRIEPTATQRTQFAWLVDALGADRVADVLHTPRDSFGALLDTFNAQNPTTAQGTLLALARML